MLFCILRDPFILPIFCFCYLYACAHIWNRQIWCLTLFHFFFFLFSSLKWTTHSKHHNNYILIEINGVPKFISMLISKTENKTYKRNFVYRVRVSLRNRMENMKEDVGDTIKSIKTKKNIIQKYKLSRSIWNFIYLFMNELLCYVLYIWWSNKYI